MQSIKKIFQNQVQVLQKQHTQLTYLITTLSQQLNKKYISAKSNLLSGKYYVNQTFIKQLKTNLQQLISNVNINAHKNQSNQKSINSTNQQERNSFLIDISLRQIHKNQSQEKQFQVKDFNQYLKKNKDNSHVVLTKKVLSSITSSRLSLHCGNTTSIHLKSHSSKSQLTIGDNQLDKIVSLKKIIRLDISHSIICENSLYQCLQELNELKQLNISSCCLVSDQTLKRLNGPKYINLKLNNLNSISTSSILSLISQSYNLNYLQIKNCRHIDQNNIFLDIANLYQANQASFKWLTVHTNSGVDLFVNKFAYFINNNHVHNINHHQVKLLFGQNNPNLNSHINGLFFSTCQQLNAQTIKLICNQISSLKRIKLSKFYKLTDTHVRQLLSQFIQLEYLNLDQCFSLTNNTLKSVNEFSTQLKYLSLRQCRSISDSGIKWLCVNKTKLEHLNLSHLKNLSNSSILSICQNCPNLKSLNLEKCDQLTDQSICYLSQKLIELEELILNYCQGLTDTSLCKVAMGLIKLNRLQLEWCQISQKSVELISQNLKNLTVINFNFTPAVCDQQIFILARNRTSSLQVLKLQSCDKLSQQAFLALSKVSKDIQQLDFRQCIGVTDEVIKQFCICAQSHIKLIDIGWCPLITDKSLFFLSQYQHQLTSLNISGCSLISDIGIQWLCSSLHNLSYLNLSLCSSLSDKSISLLNQLYKLRKLYLCDLKNITDTSIGNLADLSALQQLHLSGCVEITSGALLSIMHNLDRISTLNINDCPKIKAHFLTVMFDKLTNLKTFQLSSLEIDDTFLQNMGKHLTKLQYLNVSFCKFVSDDGLLTLIQQIPALIKLDFQNTSISNRTKQRIVHTINSRRLYNITLD